MNVKPIVLTPGEPAGIGPDLIVMLAQRPPAVDCVISADPALLYARAKNLGLPLHCIDYRPGLPPCRRGEVWVMQTAAAASVRVGQLQTANAGYVLATLRRAVQGCLSGEFSALVTGPVHKAIINDAGIPFSGHTEFLCEVTGAVQAVMMLTTPGLRVALATTHLPLTAVPAAITQPHLLNVLRIIVSDMRRRFLIPHPCIAVCGLNPHAGENGHLGREEIEIIGPALAELRVQGLNVRGPLPADTLFTPERLIGVDAVLAMYHDQGLPVLKYAGFGRAVNVTLGLPIIRTSVDHGTALDRAGTGNIDTGSLDAALALAAELAARAHAESI